MDVIISAIQWWFNLAYLDNVVNIFEHPESTYRTCMTSFGATTWYWCHNKLKKCALSSNEINYLGHIIHQQQFPVSQHEIDTTRDLKPSTKMMELRSFVGSFNVFWQFVPIFARIAAPLSREKRRDQLTHFETLTETELMAIRTMQQKLITPQGRSLPR